MLPPSIPDDNIKRLKRDLLISTQYAFGAPQRDLAPAHNLSQPTISHIVTNDKCRDIIDNAIKLQIIATEAINRRFIGLCLHKDPKISLDAIKQWQRNVGIAPSYSGNLFLTNIYNDSRSVNISADASKLLGILAGAGGGDSGSIIDGKVIENDD